jgi:hypothetical protein
MVAVLIDGQAVSGVAVMAFVLAAVIGIATSWRRYLRRRFTADGRAVQRQLDQAQRIRESIEFWAEVDRRRRNRADLEARLRSFAA